jgi:hypothetical protein
MGQRIEMVRRRLGRIFSPLLLLATFGISALAGLLWFNGTSDWIKQNGGLASWLQSLGSLYAIVAVSFPVFLQRRHARMHARQSMLTSAQMACDLMTTVASRAFDKKAQFSEWWVPQWQVIDEVMASCRIHDSHSAKALEAFVTIRELFGRMRAWDDSLNEGWPVNDGTMMSYVDTLCMNASMQLGALKSEFA